MEKIAKKVYEIQNFRRGRDPHVALDIGPEKEIKYLLDNELAMSGRQYKIHSLDNIEIYYSKMKAYFVEYKPFPRFSVEYVSGSGNNMYVIIDNPNNNYNALWGRAENLVGMWHMKVPVHKNVDPNGDKAKAEAVLIVDAFNKHYGPSYGFFLK